MPATRRAEKQDLPFEIRKSSIQGRGAFATRRIRKGERIIEYTGEVITVEESDRRYDDESMTRHHTFLFSLDNGCVIDGAVGGNESRFINHSCDPNCEAVDVKGRIFVEAIRAIELGEELAYDYAYEREGFEDEKWEKLYVCRCGAANCRGTILAPLPEGKTPATSKAGAKSRSRAKSESRVDTRSRAKTKARTKTKTGARRDGAGATRSSGKRGARGRSR